MGWANCGYDSQGRPIGYAHEANCDHPECEERIDRGLSYVCGSMHGDDEVSCEKYFCRKHRGDRNTEMPNEEVLYAEHGNAIYNLCFSCSKLLVDTIRNQSE